MTKTDQYVRYYMDQQQGHGMPIFMGTPWMRGYGQVRFGLGGLFRSLARAVMPMVKSGAKTLGKSALNAGANVLMDVSSGKDLKQAIKTRGKEVVSDARDNAINRLKTFAQTGSGKRTKKKDLPVGHASNTSKFGKGTLDRSPTCFQCNGNCPITFLSPGTEDYINLSKTILVVRAKVTKADGAGLNAGEKVGVVNNFLHSLFKQVDVYLKEKQVTQAMGTYSYRSYLETLLNYGPSAKKSQLTAALFYKDTAGKMEVADPTAVDGNEGLKARYQFSKTSGVIELAGPIFCDIFFTERLLLSFVNVKVVLNRNGHEFCLMSSVDDADYTVKLTEAYLKIRKVKVNPSITMASPK